MTRYDRCVRAAVDDPKTERLLGKRDGVTRAAVLRSMGTSAYHHFAVIPCPSTALDKAVEVPAEVCLLSERRECFLSEHGFRSLRKRPQIPLGTVGEHRAPARPWPRGPSHQQVMGHGEAQVAAQENRAGPLDRDPARLPSEAGSLSWPWEDGHCSPSARPVWPFVTDPPRKACKACENPTG